MSELNPNAPKRTSEIFMHIGQRNTGKTHMTLNSLADFFISGKRGLIFDVNNQSEYDQFRTISVDELPFWREMEIVTVREPDRIYEFFDYVNYYIRNAFIVLEDSTSYVTGNLHKSIQRVILNTRNANNDLFFNVHSLGDPGPFLYKHVDWYILRQTGDMIPLEKKVRGRDKLPKYMAEIRDENRRLYPDINGVKTPKLAYRVIDPTE